MRTVLMGREVVYKKICASTQDLAWTLLKDGTPVEGTLVITDHQYRGRGQRGKKWFTEPGQNITLSLIVSPTFLLAKDSFLLNMGCSLALQNWLSSYLDEKLKIKWPNDIYYNHQKLGGVLIETTTLAGYLKHAVIGIGININQPYFDFDGPVSLYQILGRVFELQTLVEELMLTLEEKYLSLKRGATNDWKSVYYTHLYGMGQKIPFRDRIGNFVGEVQGLDETGKLIVRSEARGEKAYGIKEIALVR